MVSPAFPGLFFAFAAAVLLLFGEFRFQPQSVVKLYRDIEKPTLAAGCFYLLEV